MSLQQDILSESNQILFEPIPISYIHHILWQGIPQFNYLFVKKIFVGFKTVTWFYSVHHHTYITRTNKNAAFPTVFVSY